jgi:hypothetical protein
VQFADSEMMLLTYLISKIRQRLVYVCRLNFLCLASPKSHIPSGRPIFKNCRSTTSQANQHQAQIVLHSGGFLDARMNKPLESDEYDQEQHTWPPVIGPPARAQLMTDSARSLS